MTTVILRRRKLGMSSAKGIAAVSETGIVAVRNWVDKFPQDTDLVIRWGCSSNAPTQNVLNTARAIHQVADKRGFRMTMEEEAPGLATRTWFDLEDLSVGQITEITDLFLEGGKVVVRRATHAQARNLDVCSGWEELKEVAWRKYGEGNYYFNELIEKKAEYRVTFVQGRVAWVAQKTPGNPEDVAWNVAKGGRFDNVRWGAWPANVLEVAAQAFLLSELDFGGVDVMVEKGTGQAYVLEINSAPSLTSPYRQQCMAKAFDYIVERKNHFGHVEAKKRIPTIGNEWSGWIHPGISEAAQVG